MIKNNPYCVTTLSLFHSRSRNAHVINAHGLEVEKFVVQFADEKTTRRSRIVLIIMLDGDGDGVCITALALQYY